MLHKKRLIFRMKTGSHIIRNNVFLASMAGVTDRPFRQLCKKLGVETAVSERVPSNPELFNTKKTRLRLDHSGEPSPRVIQIAGSVPKMLAESARFNVNSGAERIDINMGCPTKQVCKVAAAESASLRNELLRGRILDRVVPAVTVPVSLKIRTGWDTKHKHAKRIAKLAEQAGIQALTVHGRTRACGFSGKAEHETTRQIQAMGVYTGDRKWRYLHSPGSPQSA